MPYVFAEEIIDWFEGIFVRRGSEVQGAAKEMLHGVRSEELVAGGSISFQGKVYARDMVGCLKRVRVYSGSLVGVLLVRHLEGVVDQRVQAIPANFLVAEVDPPIELRKIDIDPVRIFRALIEEKGVLDDVAIHRILKRIRITGPVEFHVFFFRERYFKIASRLRGIVTAAACPNCGYE